MKLFQQVFLSLFLFVFLMPLSAQDTHSHDHDHDHHKYHIGLGIAGTKILNANVLAPGFHVHLIRQLGHHNQWGLGVGYEVIADEHWHSGLNLLVNYRLLKFVSLLAGPGLAIVKHEGDLEVLPAFHTEAVFEFDLGSLHVGPMVGYGRDTEHSHISVGIHIGLGF